MIKNVNGVSCLCKYGIEIPIYEIEHAITNGKKFLWQFKTCYFVGINSITNQYDLFFVGKREKNDIGYTKKGRYCFTNRGIVK